MKWISKSLRDRILEALKKEGLTALELSERVVTPLHHLGFYMLKLEEEGLIEYNSATEKWCLKRR